MFMPPPLPPGYSSTTNGPFQPSMMQPQTITFTDDCLKTGTRHSSPYSSPMRRASSDQITFDQFRHVHLRYIRAQAIEKGHPSSYLPMKAHLVENATNCGLPHPKSKLVPNLRKWCPSLLFGHSNYVSFVILKKQKKQQGKDAGKENLADLEEVEDEHLNKELGNISLQDFLDTILMEKDVKLFATFVDISELEGKDTWDWADALSKAIWEHMNYCFM
ncbi:hypothetical protein CPB84DRAFT_1752645 [Gymnopilus junonius]|uniref:Uncharacterized protein n=1 Tax=Gymnopilus junonius TaxID=109634 RepID=A0A9P5NB18_GYMJU|nr:hypothetical protein CPB84DRAFT_1752645 [Gymnopilus junonius]